MEYVPLETAAQLDEIKSAKGYTIIFKHNTTCPISKGARSRFEAEADDLKGVNSVYFLDLLEHRALSDSIAEKFDVEHQSPQLLLIKDGECTYHEALSSISVGATVEAIGN
ncbi:MAG: ytxJ [Segetibacter sp.]|nr:ytxJ [Segetibacter sp.]